MSIPPFFPGPAGSLSTDLCSKHGAETLARRIVGAWVLAGHLDVKADVELVQLSRGRTEDRIFYTVRTNLVAGLPPSMRGAA